VSPASPSLAAAARALVIADTHVAEVVAATVSAAPPLTTDQVIRLRAAALVARVPAPREAANAA
jgi:hypothetical protein